MAVPEIGKYVIGIISSARKAIETWQQTNDDKSVEDVIENYLRLLETKQVKNEGKMLEKLTGSLILSTAKNNLVSTWNNFCRNIQQGLSDEQMDDQIENIMHDICKETNTILRLNGKLPTKTLQEYWKKFAVKKIHKVKLYLKLAIILAVLFTQCKNPAKNTVEDEMEVSFRFHSCNEVVYLAFTEDSDSLWENEEWLNKMRHEMSMEFRFRAVVVFNSKEHIPKVEKDSINFPKEYDKYVVCEFWRFKNDSTRFCYGGINQDREFKYCKY